MKKTWIPLVVGAVAVFLAAAAIVASRRDPPAAPRQAAGQPTAGQDREEMESPEQRTLREERLIEQSKRHAEIMAECRKKFYPPAAGDNITVKLKDGTLIEGVLDQYEDTPNTNAIMTIKTSSGPVTVRKHAISRDSVLKIYTLDHLIYWTEKKMLEEFPDYKPPRNVFAFGNDGYPLPTFSEAGTNR